MKQSLIYLVEDFENLAKDINLDLSKESKKNYRGIGLSFYYKDNTTHTAFHAWKESKDFYEEDNYLLPWQH